MYAKNIMTMLLSLIMSGLVVLILYWSYILISFLKSWSFIWREQLAFKNLAANHGLDKVINSTHPRARKAVHQIYLESLDQYMQWFPWSWFSNMQFIGAGGFSAVYGAYMNTPYDTQPIHVALKVIDEKILNEASSMLSLFNNN